MNQQVLDSVAISEADPKAHYIDLDVDDCQDCLFWRISLDDIFTNPLRVNELSAEERGKLLIQLPAVQTALAAVVVMTPVKIASQQHEPDQLLTVEEAAKVLSVEPHWIYSRSKTLPFVRKLSHKCLRVSKLDMEKYLVAMVNKW
jgi:hypothetical protein